MFGRDLPSQPSISPAPRVWARQGDAVVEVDVLLGGQLGFEMIRESAKTIGRSTESEDADE